MSTFKVCTGKACKARFSEYILTRIRNDQTKFDPEKKTTIEECTCLGRCTEGPNIMIDKELLTRMNPIKASELLQKKIKQP